MSEASKARGRMSDLGAAHCLTAIVFALEAHITQGSSPPKQQMELIVAAAQAALREDKP